MLIEELGLAGFFLLHWEVLELAREVANEVRGPGSMRHVLPPGPRSRLVGRLARLLPDRSLARRPGREQALARPLPQPRARVGARHRPRLPARHPREADRPRHREVRPRARRARRELRDLPLARCDPRRRQGARPAVRGSRAARASSPTAGMRSASARRCCCCRTRRRSSRHLAGAPSPSSARRSRACRATSRSTPAGW